MAEKATQGITNLLLWNHFIQDINDNPTQNIDDIESLRYIIDETNSLIAQKCGRNFGSATYKEWVEGDGTPYLVLNNYPITNVKLISTSPVDLMTVEATGFPVATITSNGNSLVLSSIANTGVETDTVLQYATYTNVSSIVTAVDTVSGWDGTVLSSNDSALTQLIRPVASGWAVDEKVYLQGPYLGIDARVSYDSDAILESVGHGCFIGDVFVWYTAGYVLPVCDDVGGTSTTAGNVPEGLTLVANQIIKDYLNQRDEDVNMKKEGILNDYQYERDGITSAIDRHWKDLSQYARKSV